MELTHFLALLPLIIFLIMSLKFYGKGLVHLITLGYSGTLGYISILNNWELLLSVPVIFTGIIAFMLFIYSMTKGGWL